MNFERCIAIVLLTVAVLASNVAYCIEGDYPLLMIGSLFLAVDYSFWG